jgi:pimeloyl-ACP methyl ester carboxylesterase
MSWLLNAFLLPLALLLAAHLATRLAARRAVRIVPPAGRTFEVPGGTIHWVEAGEGLPVVFIHGLGGQLQHFTYALTGRLDERFRVVALDRPGSGHSLRAVGSDARLTRQAEMIAAFLAAKGVPPAIIVGHSLGGAVALALAERHPERVRALALIAPLTQPMANAPPIFRPLQIRSPVVRAFLAQTVAVPMARMTAQRTLREVFAPEPVPDDFPTRGGAALNLRPQGYLIPSEDLLAAEREMSAIASGIAELKMPVGVLYGSQDAILDPYLHGDRMRESLPEVVLERVEGAGHMLPLTQPEACARFVRAVAELAG